MKEVIRFDQKVLEDRFQLNGRSGMTNEFVGYASGGVEGGGFLYTNTDSVSIGLVLGMADLRGTGLKPYDLLNQFKTHPAVADTIRGGEVLEYSAKVVSTGDMRVMPREVYADGVLARGRGREPRPQRGPRDPGDGLRDALRHPRRRDRPRSEGRGRTSAPRSSSTTAPRSTTRT